MQNSIKMLIHQKYPLLANMIIWYLGRFLYAELNEVVQFFYFLPEINTTFLGKMNISKLIQNCLLSVKFSTYTHSNMKNSVAMLNFSVFDSVFRKISYEKPKLSFFAEIWCQEISYTEFNGGVHLLCCGWDILFLGKLGPKN